ncbi:MAG TPA: hypothetical protein VKY59_00875 [Spirillospora sp.]|nr:hypothetical protein [Spirillospora sp.]
MPERTPEELLQRFQNTTDEQFVRLLVHDLRGPLGDIISAVKLLNSLLDDYDHADEKHIRELSQILLKTADNMRLILDAALEHDRSQRGEANDA